MSKRMYESESQSTHSSHKRCNLSQKEIIITIDHTNSEDHRHHQTVLNGFTLEDNLTNIRFIVDDIEIPAHRQVINILKGKRQLVRDAIERDERNAQKEQTEAATVFQMSGTTPKGFQMLLKYIYTGRVECDLNTAIELANTGHKLKFHPLVAALAQHLAKNDCLTLKSVDDLYHIAKGAQNKELLKSCRKYMDEKAYDLINLFLKRETKSTDPKDAVVFAFDKSRYINYIHFLIPEKYEICFTLSVSTDRNNWTVVLKNDDIWSKFWNWVYFEEKRIRFIKITFTDLRSGQKFNNSEIDDQFLCKRANVDLEFDPSTGYLIPKHDVIKFPIRDTKYLFDDKLKTYTYCMSKSSTKDKLKEYYYHNIGDDKFLEFYLSQTCLIDSFRIWLWDKDDRTYDFRVEFKNEKEEEYTLIKEGTSNIIFKNKSSWQTIDLRGRRAVRWIRITGLRGPPHDSEFAVVDIECPALPKKLYTA